MEKMSSNYYDEYRLKPLKFAFVVCVPRWAPGGTPNRGLSCMCDCFLLPDTVLAGGHTLTSQDFIRVVVLVGRLSWVKIIPTKQGKKQHVNLAEALKMAHVNE